MFGGNWTRPCLPFLPLHSAGPTAVAASAAASASAHRAPRPSRSSACSIAHSNSAASARRVRRRVRRRPPPCTWPALSRPRRARPPPSRSPRRASHSYTCRSAGLPAMCAQSSGFPAAHRHRDRAEPRDRARVEHHPSRNVRVRSRHLARRTQTPTQYAPLHRLLGAIGSPVPRRVRVRPPPPGSSHMFSVISPEPVYARSSA